MVQAAGTDVGHYAPGRFTPDRPPSGSLRHNLGGTHRPRLQLTARSPSGRRLMQHLTPILRLPTQTVNGAISFARHAIIHDTGSAPSND